MPATKRDFEKIAKALADAAPPLEYDTKETDGETIPNDWYGVLFTMVKTLEEEYPNFKIKLFMEYLTARRYMNEEIKKTRF